MARRKAGGSARSAESTSGSAEGRATWSRALAQVARRLGEDSTPPCALCGQHGRATERTLRHLTNGVSVWLCEKHTDEGYLRRDGGLAFAQRLGRVWAAAGSLNARRAAALRTHVEQTSRGRSPRDLPGSYSWPQLRKAAEQRFAAGEDPADVIADLRERHAHGPADAPSVRTMRRWFTQARWMNAPPSRLQRAVKKWWDDRSDVPWEFILLPKCMLDVLPILYPSMRRRAP